MEVTKRASITPEGLLKLVSGIRKIEKSLLGSEEKNILEIEKPVAKKLRSHLKKMDLIQSINFLTKS